MSPRSAHAEHRALIVERLYAPDPERCVRAIIALLTRPPAAVPDRPPDSTPDVETATVATATVSGRRG